MKEMNFKVLLATVAAVILGVFLIVITAIKFDWVGKVERGEKIFNFSTEKKENEPEVNKPIDNDENDNQNDNNNNNNDNSSFIIDCVTSKDENGIIVNHSITATVENDVLTFLNYNINFGMIDPAQSGVFNTLVNNYSALSNQYQNILGLNVSTNLVGNDFQYLQHINYSEVDDTTLISLSLPNKTASAPQINALYTSQGYQCTQR